jgi:hypothetical protein
MSPISQRKLRDLHAVGEGSRLDYKAHYFLSSNAVKVEFAKDTCALGNFLYQTSGKAHLIIGTDDNGTPIGINHIDYDEARIQQILNSRADPPPICTVNHVTYTGVNLTVLEFTRNPLGPHQHITNGRPSGFPIRRGSTTGMMTTNEVFQAMQSRGRNFERQRSEYETFSPHLRSSTMMTDCQTGLEELGYSLNSIKQISYSGADITAFTIHPPRTFLKITKVINSRRWNIFFSFEGDKAKQWDLFGFDGSSIGLIRQHSLPHHRSIFIHFIHGTVSSSYYTNREENWSRFIRVSIEPHITYFGIGQGVIPRSYSDEIYMPKFYVSHIKSKEDIKTRVQVILTWIEQRPQLFEDIRAFLL